MSRLTKRHRSRGLTRRAARSIQWERAAARWSRPTGIEQDEERFLTDLSKRLNAAVMAGETKSLVLVAPPRALGVLRQAFTNGLRDAIRAEIDKDYVKMPVHEIEKKLAA